MSPAAMHGQDISTIVEHMPDRPDVLLITGFTGVATVPAGVDSVPVSQMIVARRAMVG
ncbi:MAG: hypothetical protein JRG89_07130 [Deltaproteobacteria bacterium]|nr:hypothetical protein [Deltaproteobacteria bacterium]